MVSENGRPKLTCATRNSDIAADRSLYDKISHSGTSANQQL